MFCGLMQKNPIVISLEILAANPVNSLNFWKLTSYHFAQNLTNLKVVSTVGVKTMLT